MSLHSVPVSLFGLLNFISRVFIPIAFCLAVALAAVPSSAQPTEDRLVEALLPLDTSSPRAALSTLLRLTDQTETAFLSFQNQPSPETQQNLRNLSNKLTRLLDLSAVPPIEQSEVGTRAMLHLVDVIRRLDLPELGNVPEKVTSTGELVTKWAIPGTELTIGLVEAGDRAGEYLFTPDTVARAEEFDLATRNLPGYDPRTSWRLAGIEVHGWMIPPALVSGLPGWAHSEVLGDPLWKHVLAALALAIVSAIFLFMWRLTASRGAGTTVLSQLQLMVQPLLLLISVGCFQYFIFEQLLPLGPLSQLVVIVCRGVFYLGSAWLIWRVIMLAAETIISSPRIAPQSLDANLIRLSGRLSGILLVVLLFTRFAQDFGVSVIGIAAGLGAGGLAFGLAAQSSIENLIGALTLYFDKPFRTGDYCRIGQHTGTVEEIGLRSTTIRGLDRSVVSIPNSTLTRGEIVNFTRRDKFLMRHRINLRYDAPMASIRELVADLADQLSATDFVSDFPMEPRVAIVEFADWSVVVEVFAYLHAEDFTEFVHKQEVALDLIRKLIEAKDIGLAFPTESIVLENNAEISGEPAPANGK